MKRDPITLLTDAHQCMRFAQALQGRKPAPRRSPLSRLIGWMFGRAAKRNRAAAAAARLPRADQDMPAWGSTCRRQQPLHKTGFEAAQSLFPPPTHLDP